jgi:hypothetical protein
MKTPKKKKARTRPTCPMCRRYADRERDVKGKFYVKCYGCEYDSRAGGY